MYVTIALSASHRISDCHTTSDLDRGKCPTVDSTFVRTIFEGLDGEGVWYSLIFKNIFTLIKLFAYQNEFHILVSYVTNILSHLLLC